MAWGGWGPSFPPPYPPPTLFPSRYPPFEAGYWGASGQGRMGGVWERALRGYGGPRRGLPAPPLLLPRLAPPGRSVGASEASPASRITNPDRPHQPAHQPDARPPIRPTPRKTPAHLGRDARRHRSRATGSAGERTRWVVGRCPPHPHPPQLTRPNLMHGSRNFHTELGQASGLERGWGWQAGQGWQGVEGYGEPGGWGRGWRQ